MAWQQKRKEAMPLLRSLVLVASGFLQTCTPTELAGGTECGALAQRALPQSW